MEQEDKDILLKYLCMALPYGVMIKEEYGDYINVNLYNAHLEHLIDRISDGLDKLVLRPMSSMTEEEREQLKSLYDAENVTNESICFLEGGTEAEISFVFCYGVVEWLLKHHFDFMGLIPKNLAIEVTKENNPYEN